MQTISFCQEAEGPVQASEMTPKLRLPSQQYLTMPTEARGGGASARSKVHRSRLGTEQKKATRVLLLQKGARTGLQSMLRLFEKFAVSGCMAGPLAEIWRSRE